MIIIIGNDFQLFVSVMETEKRYNEGGREREREIDVGHEASWLSVINYKLIVEVINYSEVGNKGSGIFWLDEYIFVSVSVACFNSHDDIPNDLFHSDLWP